MPIPKNEFRQVMGQFATGVAIIATRTDSGEHTGMTANSLTSVSLEPPLLLICVDKEADCYRAFGEFGAFTVNVLAVDQEDVSRKFASKGATKFEGVGFHTGANGCAVLDDAVAALECRIVDSHDAGDHTIHVAEVERAEGSHQSPLVFYRGGYRRLAP